MDPRIQQLLEHFQKRQESAGEQAHQHYIKGQLSAVPDCPVCKERSICNALTNRAAAFHEAIMTVRRLFSPEFFKDDEGEKGSKVTDAQHSKLKKKILGLETRLSNPKFMEKASKEIQESSKAELEKLRKELASCEQS
jgi:valyl-tRNA synthetase